MDIDIDLLFLKIDFDKAYDRIEWDFFSQCLMDFSHGSQFINFVKVLL